jgi:threonine dehydratase
VSEQDLRHAVAGLVEHEHLVAEGAGAAATAALLGARIDDIRDRRVVVILSGSNIDRARLSEILKV